MSSVGGGFFHQLFQHLIALITALCVHTPSTPVTFAHLADSGSPATAVAQVDPTPALAKRVQPTMGQTNATLATDPGAATAALAVAGAPGGRRPAVGATRAVVGGVVRAGHSVVAASPPGSDVTVAQAVAQAPAAVGGGVVNATRVVRTGVVRTSQDFGATLAGRRELQKLAVNGDPTSARKLASPGLGCGRDTATHAAAAK